MTTEYERELKVILENNHFKKPNDFKISKN